MRFKKEQAEFLSQSIISLLPDADIFLFGSRAHDHLRGGDIDILVIGQNKLSNQQVRELKIAFYKRFGEQKIDIVSYTRSDENTFKSIALNGAVKL